MLKTALSNLRNSSLVNSILTTVNARVLKHKGRQTKIERPRMSVGLPKGRRLSSKGARCLQEPTEIAIAAIFYNEAEYFKEWIEFHLMVGVDRFYLYDNGSTDEFLPILEPYIRRGQIVLMPWAAFVAEASAQRLAYAHAASNFAATVRWLILIDIDEFLFSETVDDLKPIFAKFEAFAALTIPRFEFGPNGHKDKPSGLVIENYTRVRKRNLEPGSSRNSKVAIQPCLTTEIGTHKCIVEGETLAIEAIDSGRLDLRINHYFSKSESEFENKMRRGYSWKIQRGKLAANVIAKKNSMLKAITDHDDEHYSMSHFAERLKARI